MFNREDQNSRVLAAKLDVWSAELGIEWCARVPIMSPYCDSDGVVIGGVPIQLTVAAILMLEPGSLKPNAFDIFNYLNKRDIEIFDMRAR